MSKMDRIITILVALATFGTLAYMTIYVALYGMNVQLGGIA